MQPQPRTTLLVLASSIAIVIAIAACESQGAQNPNALRPERTPPSARDMGFDCDALARFDGRGRYGHPTPVMASPANAMMESRVDAVAVAPPPPPAAPQKTLTRKAMPSVMPAPMPRPYFPNRNTENYQHFDQNPVKRTGETPLSTFSIDVDTGSYSNVRRMLNDGQRPPADAVRAEEFINYFDYGYAAPTRRDTPFAVRTDLTTSPWNSQRQLLMVGIKGYEVPKSQLPPANLVFLVDTSGSMMDADKLPLVKQGLCRMLPQLRAEDRISIVAYAGSAGLVLPPTRGSDRRAIYDALARLEAGGSTNGGEGIQLAYAEARRGFIKGGVNRVLLATDGDFNVGVFDRHALETLVSDQRESGVALSTLGFGTGNYNDEMAERLADAGDGNYSYIDSVREAERVLVRNMQSTLMTIAQDVKIQVEFNPAQVAEYWLIGYENRALRDEDFDNDAVDAVEIGAGHEVTALYEIALVGSGGERLPKLRYASTPSAQAGSGEIANLKLRYQQPGGSPSRLIERPIRREQLRGDAGPDLRFAAAVAAFADLLRGGRNIEGWDAARIRQLATSGTGKDRDGERREFIDLVDRADRLMRGGTDPDRGSID